MHENNRFIDSVVAAIADHAAIDWQKAERTSPTSCDHALIRQLKIISAVAASPSGAAVMSPRRWRLRPMGATYAFTAALGAAKALVGVLSARALFTAAGDAAFVWPHLAMVVAFGASGVLLIFGGAKDRRVRLLGALFVIIASAFADPLIRGMSDGALGAYRRALAAPPEAFLAVALWLFVWSFPSEPQRQVERRVAAAFVSLSAAIGVLLFTANVLLAGRPAGARGAGIAVLGVLDRQVPTLAFWPLLFGVAAPAIPYLVWKTRFETLAERRRVSFFITALVVGITPMLVAVMASPLIPALEDPSRRRVIGLFLDAALLSVIPTTAYAAVVHRVVNVHLIARKTMQHTMARHAVWFASIGPLAYLVVQTYLHRDQTVRDFLGRGESIGLLLLSLLGFVTLTFRQQLLATVDRFFHRQPTDYVEALARFERSFRTSRSIREVTGVLTQEVDRAVHPRAVVALIVNDDGSELVSLSERVLPLSTASTLVELLRSTQREIQLDADGGGPVARLLPRSDRQWLADGGFQLLSPLVGSAGTLLGVLAIAESRSGFPYTRQHRAFIAAMGGQVAVVLENQLLRSLPGGGARASALETSIKTVDWSNEPAVCCPLCSRVWSARTIACACGAETAPAALPLMVNGKFRVERLISAGGMGVVYLAVDVALNRRVAIKTLPITTLEHATRLQREARAMASVLHPNLAMIFGLESWRSTPLLIVEYLEGGTLADRLRDGPLPVHTVIDLGVLLADALDRMHASGILHRDIKPSNIGYTYEGLPKLLDFGLAAMLERSGGAEGLLLREGSEGIQLPDLMQDRDAVTTLTAACRVVGTPLYLAPEAVAGERPQPSFDLWSLNLVLYEALAGRLPLSGKAASEVLAAIRHFKTPDVREFRPGCPAAVAAFFESPLDLSLQRRPATASELRDRLQRLRADVRLIGS